MKIFISYRFTGEDPEILKQSVETISQALEKAGFEVSGRLEREDHFKTNNFTVKEIMNDHFNDLDTCDAILAYVTSDNKSEGMLIEVGYALAKGKKVVLAKKQDTKTHSLSGVSDQIIEFSNLEDLSNKLADLKI